MVGDRGQPAVVHAAGPLTGRLEERTVEQAGEQRSVRIESLRALAALGVLVGHAFGWHHLYGPGAYESFVDRALLGGGFGVFLFFALSGYLLFLPFARAAWGEGADVRHGSYLFNRALRVLPLYYVVMTVYLALNGDGLRDDWWRFALLLQSFWSDSVAQVNPPVWSLVVEVQFYVLLPLLAAALALVARGSLSRAMVLVSTLTVLLAVVRLATVTLVEPSPVWRYSLPATATFFGPGMLLALLQLRYVRSRPAWTLRSPLAEPLLWLSAGALLTSIVFWRYTWDLLLLPATFLALGACVLPLRSQTGLHWLGWRPLGLLGVASYSLYLWHEPLVEALSRASWMPDGFVPLLVVSLVVSIVVAGVSYRLVETPFLRLRRHWQQPQARTG